MAKKINCFKGGDDYIHRNDWVGRVTPMVTPRRQEKAGEPAETRRECRIKTVPIGSGRFL